MAKVTIQGKITSKKISTWLKSTFQHHSVLAISPPEDTLLQQDLDNHNELDHPHDDADGYLSDSSFLSHGEMIEPYSTSTKTRPPLRRAISLEDIATATEIHHHLQSTERLRTTANSFHNPTTRLRSKSNATALLLNPLASPPIRPASASSAYHRQHLHRPPFVAEPLEISYEPLKDSSQSSMAIYDQRRRSHPTIVPTQDKQDAALVPRHLSLPTPDVSPEELSSESSDDIVIVDGDVLEESKSVLGLDYYMRSTGQLRQQTYPGAVASGEQGRHGTALYPETRTLGDGASMIDNGLETASGSWSWLTDSPFLDALVNWIEGPDTATQQKSQDKDSKPNPWLDIPFQFIALLTYPEPDPKNGNKMTLAMVRETAFVRQRRKTLMMLTAYTLIVRYCSFDFFILVLFASNCAMLFLMKNSGRMNVNMAKRAVRQRVGWAKQWAGSIFKRGGNNSQNIASHHGHGHGHSANEGHNRSNSSSLSQINGNNNFYHTSSAVQSSRSSPAPPDVYVAAPETSPQMKRKGLFGKRVPVTTSHSSQPSNSTYTQGTASTSSTAGPIISGDTASVLNSSSATITTTTTKRRFFRRNQTGNNNSTMTIASSATASSLVPIPAKANTIAHYPSHSATPFQGKSSGSVIAMSSSHTTTTSATRSTTSMGTNAVHSPPLSGSPPLQTHSLPQLQLSPLKPLNLPMLTSDTEMEQADVRWAARSQPLAMTPPPVVRSGSSGNNDISMSNVGSDFTTGQRQGHAATTLSSSSSSSTTSSPKANANNEGVLSPIPISPICNTRRTSNTTIYGQKQGAMILSGLSQLLSRSSSTSPPPLPSSTADIFDGSGETKSVQDQYSETSNLALHTGALDPVTSAAAADMEDV
ncbi:hypothetical protein FBU30_007951 [Linnemannia zychae]|nr:hypothetical protein FBU30_007951 [Linnemannia zychae]